MDSNANGRVDITTRCRPDYSRPEPEASIYGFVIEYGSEQIEFWTTTPEEFFWKVGLKKYDYYRVYSDFEQMSRGRSKLAKLIKPAFKFAEEHDQPIYVNGLICCRFREVEVDEPVVEETLDAITTG